MAKIKVAEYNEISEGDMRKVEVEGVFIALYKIEGKIYATSDICTHEGCYLDENHKIHNYMIECTCHNSQFDIKTGEVVLPPATEKLKTYVAEVVGADIYVDM